VGDRLAFGPAASPSVPADRSRIGVCGRARAEPAAPSPHAAPFRAEGCVIGGFFVLALLILVTTRALPVAVRAVRRVRPELGGDRAAALLVLAVGGLPVAYRDWGQAMCNELDHVRGARARWRFSIGCAWAAGLIHTRAMFSRPARGARNMRAVVFTGIAGALTLAVYGLFHYPGLRSGYNVWASFLVFLALLLGYAVLTLALSSRQTAQSGLARRYGLAGGLAIGAAWFVIFSPTDLLKGWVMVPLAVVLLGPAGIAALVGRSARDARTGTQAALWSGIVGGLVVFIVWVTATYLRDGRPYDSGLLRDFHKSGALDLATYAVSENLGSGLVLLLIVPIVALALGSVTARLAAGSQTGLDPTSRP
jgi:hypothetical protein